MTSSVKPPLLTRSRQSSTQQATEDEMVTGIAVSRDHLIFAESPLTPGVPIIYRPPEERIANPDRLNLDRKHLNICPILEVFSPSIFSSYTIDDCSCGLFSSSCTLLLLSSSSISSHLICHRERSSFVYLTSSTMPSVEYSTWVILIGLCSLIFITTCCRRSQD